MKPRNRRQPKRPSSRGPPPEQQNVKAVSVWQCAVTTAPRNCYPSCYAEQSYKDNVRSSAVGEQLKQKKSNFQAQHHLPVLDLFWDNFFVRVQLTSLLLISPGLCMTIRLHQSASLYRTPLAVCGRLQTQRVCHALRPMSKEDGILGAEVPSRLQSLGSNTLFGLDFSKTFGWVGPTQSIGWSYFALISIRRQRLRVKSGDRTKRFVSLLPEYITF